ncbi:MAG TPA: sigma-70 family RNA polymerase sigma factor [Spirochaetota bacterium]
MKNVKRNRELCADTDDELTARIIKGDADAFSEIVGRYKDRVYGMAFRVLGDPDEADECAQDIFVRIYNTLPSFRAESALSTWIYRVAYNLSLDYARKRKRKKKREAFSADDGDCDPSFSDPRSNPESIALRNEELRQIQSALLKIDDDQRELIILCDIEGKDYDEIRAITGLAMGTIKSRISRGRVKLRELLRGMI